jgi:hypothetical protein
MQRRAFWRAVTVDRSDLLDRFLLLLREQSVRFCVIGGQAVNAYAEPVVSLDLDLVVVASDLQRLEPLLEKLFDVERFEHSLNVSDRGSDLRIQIQLDPRYAPFIERSTEREVLGERLSVAAIEDVLMGKVWAASDSQRRASKRQKDLADIARLLEVQPELRDHLPRTILDRLV